MLADEQGGGGGGKVLITNKLITNEEQGLPRQDYLYLSEAELSSGSLSPSGLSHLTF